MRTRQYGVQSGFALLIFVVVLMGIGGIALTGFAQKSLKEVEKRRFEHNKEVLQAAKDALLMFAYNYPVTHSGQGPGRLPCPYDQIPIGAGSGYSTGGPSNAICNKVGRLPWSHTDLQLPEFKDADGEHLWYAVSKDFDNNATPIINSDTNGTISIKDQTGNMIYNGAVSGVAAVIIAPGPAIIIDDDNDGSLNYQQVRNRNDPTDTDNFDPKNFLDSAYGGTALSENNSSFTNSALNGFILGPILDGDNTLLMNDQFVIIRAEEVIEMAEKATLQAYRDAINNYLTNTGANNYPWLFDYNVGDLKVFSGLATTLSSYPDGALTHIGRIPSTFSRYFSEENSKPIETEIRLIVDKSFELSGIPFSYTFDLQSSVLDNMFFLDSGTPTDGQGELKADPGIARVEKLIYFSETSYLSGIWQRCTPPADSLPDCNRDASGNFYAGPNIWKSRVTWVGVELDFTSGIDIDLDYSVTPTLNYIPASATPDTHAEIQATLAADKVLGIDGKFFWVRGIYDTSGVFTRYFDDEQSIYSNVDQDLITNLLSTNTTIGLRYYPELPNWAHESENDWHDSIMMAIAQDYRPDGISNDCATNGPCLTVSDIGGVTNDKVWLLTLAGEVGALVDGGVAGYSDDLIKIFDSENADGDSTFLRLQGNDTVMVVQ